MSVAEDELAPLAPPPTPDHSRRRTIVVLVVLAGLVVALAAPGLLSNLNYFETVDQVLASRASLGSHPVRLEGVVVAGSVVRTARGADFLVRGSRGSIEVHEVGAPPELFGPNIPVVVAGHFASATAPVFAGTQILVKHTAQYIAAHPARVRAPNGSVR